MPHASRHAGVRLAAAALFAFAALAARQAAPAGAEDVLRGYDTYLGMRAESPYAEADWSHLGPTNISGRAVDVDVADQDGRRRIYAAYATSGVWASDDHGRTWSPVFEHQASTSIGDIAVAPSDPDTIWVGTGESNIYRGSMAGVGVYRSTDAGRTWAHRGLTDTHTIGRIAVHPTDADIVYVAASGHEWTDNDMRGVFKTTDGGGSWSRVLYESPRTGAIDLVMDPRDPDTLYAALWQRVRRKWSDPRVEPGYAETGIFKTTDAGRTWTPINAGLPPADVRGRIGLDISRARPDTLYAVVDNHTIRRPAEPGEMDAYGRPFPAGGGLITGADLYRSDDGGASWRRTSRGDEATAADMDSFFGTYGWVFSKVRVDPTDADTVYILGVPLALSRDGGRTFTRVVGMSTSNADGSDTGPIHFDHHGLWIDPANPSVLYSANDGGLYASEDAGRTWTYAVTAGGTQFYTLALDASAPTWAYGSVQDYGSRRGRVIVRADRSAMAVPFEPAPGGEATYHAIDPGNPDLVYSHRFYGRFMRTDMAAYPERDGAARWNTVRVGPDDPALRAQWLAPILMSPHDAATLYAGYQFVYRSRSRGEAWTRISPVLTGDDPAKIGVNPFAIPYQTISALAESPLVAGLLYAGTDDGRLQVTENGGEQWRDASAGLPAPAWVSRVVPSAHEADTVFVAQRGREDDDFAPYLSRSADRGRTFRSIVGNIPSGPVNVIREDPRMPRVLYAGTDFGVYVTVDGGNQWHVLGSNLPSVQVSDLQYDRRNQVIVIATYGRGLWAFDGCRVVSCR